MTTLPADFYGELTTEDPRSSRSIYIRVFTNAYKEKVMRLYNAPPSPGQSWEIAWVGDFGTMWRIRRTNRGILLSKFVISFIEDNENVEYLADNKFGDMLEQSLVST